MNVLALIAAVKAGKQEEVLAHLAEKPEHWYAHQNGAGVVQIAVYHGHQEFARELTQRHPDPDIWSISAAGVEFLVTLKDQDVNELSPDGFTPLCLACAFGRLATSQNLIQFGAEVNRPSIALSGIYPVHAAVLSGRTSVLRLLLNHGADLTLKQNEGLDALRLAMQQLDTVMAEALVRAGARL